MASEYGGTRKAVKILIVCPARSASATGNASTANRIQSYFSRMTDLDCILSEPASIVTDNEKCSQAQLQEFISENHITGMLFLHAYKSAHILVCDGKKHPKGCKDLPIPYGVIFGGTDLNVDVHDKEKYDVMQHILHNAAFAVAFNKALKTTAMQLSPSSRIFIQPQAVDIPTNFRSSCMANAVNIKKDLYVFLMVTGIRSVKDPVFLLDDFFAWSEVNQRSDVRLLILGPILDQEYAHEFFDRLGGFYKDHNDNLTTNSKLCYGSIDSIYDWMFSTNLPIHYSPPLCCNDLQELMMHPNVLATVNSSLSEGMASAILEAMVLGLPVVARKNPGNCSLVTDGKTGLLFDTPEEFVSKAESLIGDDRLRKTVVDNAFRMVSDAHSVEKEKAFYQDVCMKFFNAETYQNGHN